MEISLTTPALLFPAISLLMLAHANRFKGLGSLIRNLHTEYKTNESKIIRRQITKLWYALLLPPPASESMLLPSLLLSQLTAVVVHSKPQFPESASGDLQSYNEELCSLKIFRF